MSKTPQTEATSTCQAQVRGGSWSCTWKATAIPQPVEYDSDDATQYHCCDLTGGSSWIACDLCVKWFHHTCVELTIPLEEIEAGVDLLFLLTMTMTFLITPR